MCHMCLVEKAGRGCELLCACHKCIDAIQMTCTDWGVLIQAQEAASDTQAVNTICNLMQQL